MKRILLIFICSLLSLNIFAQENGRMEPVQGSDVFTIVEEMPEFPGGIEGMMKYLRENIKYPAEAKDTGASGTVYINFIVDTDGKIINSKILRGVNEPLNNEALRVINTMPLWKPGKQKGKAVKVSYNLPIRFALDTPKVAPKVEE